MAISRAQIPESIDIFQEGGDVSFSLTPEDIIAFYGAVESAPITPEDIQAQSELMASIMPEPRKQNVFDLASAVGAGLVGAASDPRGIGAGLTVGFDAFNQKSQMIKDQKDKVKQELALLAYKQVETKRQEQLATSKEILEMQFKAALEGDGGLFGGNTVEANALNFILRAEQNPALKDTPEYKIAVAVASKPRTSLQSTETGVIEVETPGLDIEAILGTTVAPGEQVIDGVTYTLVPGKTVDGKQVYRDPDGNEGTFSE